MKIIYHDDADGIMSAFLVNHVLKANGFIKINYGDNYAEKIKGILNEPVYVVDFFDEPLLDLLLQKCPEVTVIDHHKTTIERANNLKNAGAVVRQRDSIIEYQLDKLTIFVQTDPKKAACITILEMFKLENSLNEADLGVIKRIGFWDIWNRNTNYDWIKDIYMYKQAVEFLGLDKILKAKSLSSAVKDTLLIVEQNEIYLAKVNLKSLSQANFQDLRVALFNTPFRSSMLYEIPVVYGLIEDFHPDIIMAYNKNQENIITVSMYQYKNKNIDLGSIARRLGGGGHKGAAGFQCGNLMVNKKGEIIIS